MRVQTETELSFEIPDRCGNNCLDKSWTCALTGALYVTRLVFENADKIETPEDATAAKASLDSAGDVLRSCDAAVHDEGLAPATSTMDLDGNVTFKQPSTSGTETIVYIQKLAFVDPGDVFGKV